MAKHGIDSRPFLALLVCVGSASAQGIPPPEPVRRAVADDSTARAIFEGFVLDPDGAPSEGAVVVSSAGGRAVTDAAGSYRLDVEVPREATSVQLTAVASTGGNQVASSNVTLVGASHAIHVDTLTLSLGTSCSPSWLPTFGGLPGPENTVHALEAYDAGNGPELYVGGLFQFAGGVAARNIAKWDGKSWSEVGGGMNAGVGALAVYDDGGGLALYAGGGFWIAGGVSANGIAKWDGSSWSGLGTGIVLGSVFALAAYDDGGGMALYAGGHFTSAGGVVARNIAKWDGTSWTAVGGGVDDDVTALAVYDDGSGPALYAAGRFVIAGGAGANRVARWDGSSWSALGGGLNSTVNALTVFDDGSGSALYAGGQFNVAGGVPAINTAKWDGSSWSALGSSGSGSNVRVLEVHYDGSGPALYAGGDFTTQGGVAARHIARWDGTNWSPLGSGLERVAYALATFDASDGPALYVGGSFTSAGGVGVARVARWDGTSWAPLGRGLSHPVRALAVLDAGDGPALHVGGDFPGAGGEGARFVARWSGSSWAPLGSGMNGPVDAMAVRDAGGEQTLFAGGSFTTAGGVQANRIAQWDGSSWAPLGSGMDWVVSALVVHDDGGGPALYVGGGFGTAGGVTATRIAKWDGATWSSLGAMHLVGRLSWVLALTTFDDGNGSALYAGGDFTSAGGVPANYVAKWDGSSWSALGSGMNSTVKALVVLDDGSGPALYAGGTFTSAGGVAANRIARWDGTGWSALGDGMNNGVEALAAHDDGSGRALFAGGSFTVAGGVAANRVARWDGTGWSALGSGMNGSIDLFVVGSIKAFVGYDDGTGSALIAGGLFTSALDSGDSFVAKWSCPVVVEQCVQGLGHWKTHACDWPAPFVPGTPDPTDADGNGIPDDLEGQCGVRGNAPGSQCPCDALHTITIGSIAYDQCELLCSLAQPVQGNALRLLARHLIAAKLNVLNGASDEGVVQASCAGLPPNPYDGYTVAELIAAGDNLIATGTTDGIDTFACAGTANCPCPAFPANILTDCVPTSAAHGNTLGPAMTAVAQLLELYSEGCGGVPRCVPAQFLQDEHEPRRR